MKNNNKPIGVFDSGLGGLTVLKQLKEKLPNEQFIYFGDTAHVPYGNKSPTVIIEYCQKIIQFLIQQNVKMIIVACNTASSIALFSIKKNINIPIIDVISPSINAVCKLKKINNVGIIGTEATINSQEYQKEIKKRKKGLNIHSKACPLLVPIIEEGLFNHKIATTATKMYLQNIINKVDVLILGCTHYPILKKTIKRFTKKTFPIIDSAEETANHVKTYLNNNNLCRNKDQTRFNDLYFVSDKVVRFNEISKMFLKQPINNIEQIKLQ